MCLYRSMQIINARIQKTEELQIKLETKATTTSSHCDTGRICLPLLIVTRENTSLAINVVQKITIIRAQKIGKFTV